MNYFGYRFWFVRYVFKIELDGLYIGFYILFEVDVMNVGIDCMIIYFMKNGDYVGDYFIVFEIGSLNFDEDYNDFVICVGGIVLINCDCWCECEFVQLVVQIEVNKFCDNEVEVFMIDYFSGVVILLCLVGIDLGFFLGLEVVNILLYFMGMMLGSEGMICLFE